MARSEHDKERLREAAKDSVGPIIILFTVFEVCAGSCSIAGHDEVEIDPEETTGEDDFKHEQSPNVCSVVVDKNSGRGFVPDRSGEIFPRDWIIFSYLAFGQSAFHCSRQRFMS